MKIFISWSKELSRECAEILQDWIKCTLQASKPWVSSTDLDKGSLWFNGINDQLKDTGVGIVCLTKENKNNPWILFESGALAKGLTVNRVYTFLIDLNPSDIKDPLAQFNHTKPTKPEMKKLLESINKQLGEQGLETKILDQVFDTYWPQFQERFKAAVKKHPPGEVIENETRSDNDILAEILNTTRRLDKRVRSIENKGASGASVNSLRSVYNEIPFLHFPDIKNKHLPRVTPGKLKKLIDEGYSYEDVINEFENDGGLDIADKGYIYTYFKAMAGDQIKK